MTTYHEPHLREHQLAEEKTASIGELFADITRDLSTLIKQEVELAKVEARRSARRAGRGVVLLGTASAAVLLALAALSVAAWWSLGDTIGRNWSALAVAGGWLLLALIFAGAGRSQLRDVPGLPQTVATTRRIPDAIKGKGR